MPVHAVVSTVRPASFLYGPGTGYAGPNAMSFPQYVLRFDSNPISFDSFSLISPLRIARWLGQNSKQNKLSRQLGEVQIHMRLKVSGDKNEIRQSYVPALFPHIVQPLIDRGAVSTSISVLSKRQFLHFLFEKETCFDLDDSVLIDVVLSGFNRAPWKA